MDTPVTIDAPQPNDGEALVPTDAAVGKTPARPRALGKREFLKTIAAAAGIAAGSQLLAAPDTAEAASQVGQGEGGGDLVDTHLTVQGNLTIKGALNTNKNLSILAWDNSTYHNIYVSASALHLNTIANKDIRFYSPTNAAGTSVFTMESNYPTTWNRILDLKANGDLAIDGSLTTGGVVIVNGVTAIDASGVATKAYYAP